MKLFLILSSLLAIQAGVIKESEEYECTEVIIDGVYQDVEVLHEKLDRPFLLAVDYSTNNLYFSYSVKEDDDVFRSARLNLNTKDMKDIEGITNGFAQTVDYLTNEVYIGGSDGIYRYNSRENKGELIGLQGVNIWTLFFKQVLYYSTFPSQFLYKFVDGKSRRVTELEDTKVENFVIDNDSTIFFSNSSGLYGQKMGTKDAVLYKETDKVGVRGLTTDTNGNVYACFGNGIYAVRKTTQSVERILEIDDAFGLAFDNDNHIIYADATKIIRLKPNKHRTC